MKKLATQEIIAAKQDRVAHRKVETPLDAMRALAGMQKRPEPILSTVTNDSGVMLFGQIRHGNPAYDPVAQALRYTRMGIDGIALFTDGTIYTGGINDLALITRATPTPVLLQNFILDEYQVVEARAAGAAALTLVAKLVERPVLRMLISTTQRNRMSASVRVKDADELAYALDLCPAVIELGGRDSETGDLELQRITALREQIGAASRVLIYDRLRSFDEVEAVAKLKPNAVLIHDSLLAEDGAVARLREIFE